MTYIQYTRAELKLAIANKHIFKAKYCTEMTVNITRAQITIDDDDDDDDVLLIIIMVLSR